MLGISYLSYECYKDLIMRSSLFVRRSSKAEIGVRMLAGGTPSVGDLLFVLMVLFLDDGMRHRPLWVNFYNCHVPS